MSVFSLDAVSTDSPPAREKISFVLSKNANCESRYEADDLATQKKEKACVAFDLSGYKASAFQGGMAFGEVGEDGELRPFWPLFDLAFNTDPRPLPNPIVSPLIFFRFVRDEQCPSGYSGELLDHPNTEKGCLIFSMSGFRGEARREVKFLGDGSESWIIEDAEFFLPKERQ